MKIVMARERLATTEAAAAKAATANNSSPKASSHGAAASEFWRRRPLARVLQECNTKPSVVIKLPGRKSEIELNRCYRGREHSSCMIAALLAEANSIKDDYAEIVAADYPNVKTIR